MLFDFIFFFYKISLKEKNLLCMYKYIQRKIVNSRFEMRLNYVHIHDRLGYFRNIILNFSLTTMNKQNLYLY